MWLHWTCAWDDQAPALVMCDLLPYKGQHHSVPTQQIQALIRHLLNCTCVYVCEHSESQNPKEQNQESWRYLGLRCCKFEWRISVCQGWKTREMVCTRKGGTESWTFWPVLINTQHGTSFNTGAQGRLWVQSTPLPLSSCNKLCKCSASQCPCL